MIKGSDLESIVALADAVQRDNNPMNNDLLDVYEGNLFSHVSRSMAEEFNENAHRSAEARLAPINILKRTTDKLAKVYSQGVERSSGDGNESDENLISEYENIINLNNQMAKADSMVNLLRSCAFEPYIRDGNPNMRVLTPNQFTVWSNDSHDKMNATVFVKFLGTNTIEDTLDEITVTRQVNVYALYDHDEWLTIDSDLNVMSRAPHGFGRIPFTYMNLSSSKLIPTPDKDSYCVSILIPKLLSDLNYASKYLSHGIRYAIDVDISNLEGNPDSLWLINSRDGENVNPSVGVIAPSVDIDKVLNLTREQLIMYLESRSLKVGASGKFDSSTSGFAKLIDSADVTDVRKENMNLFKSAEMDLWELISIKHNVWVTNEEIEVKNMTRLFSPDFKVSLKYGDLAPIMDPQEKRDNIEFKLRNKFTTYERAVRESNPDMTRSEQDTLIEELKNEKPVTPNEVDRNSRSGLSNKGGEGNNG